MERRTVMFQMIFNSVKQR